MKKIIVLAMLMVLLTDCSVIKTITNLSRLKFRLTNAYDVQVAGVLMNGKTQLSDFTSTEILKISSSFFSGSLPIALTLNVEAKNPNDGSGGYPRTNASINSFPFRFVINNSEVFNGNISSPVFVPGTGEAANIPVSINLNLIEFFKNNNYEELINLGLQIAGIGKGTSNICLYAKPTVNTNFGEITYPREIKIVDIDYSN